MRSLLFPLPRANLLPIRGVLISIFALSESLTRLFEEVAVGMGILGLVLRIEKGENNPLRLKPALVAALGESSVPRSFSTFCASSSSFSSWMRLFLSMIALEVSTRKAVSLDEPWKYECCSHKVLIISTLGHMVML